MNLFKRLKYKRLANKYKAKENPNEIQFVIENTKLNQTVFDIGAHKGAYSYFLNKGIGSNGQLHIFEPQSYYYEYLLMIKRIFNWKNTTINKIALSNDTGKATLNIPLYRGKVDSQSATLLTHKDRNLFQTEEVNLDTIDNYCLRNSLIPNLIKIDVEGNELNVLLGGINTINKYKPIILIEIESRHVGLEKANNTFKFFKDAGYNGYFFFENKKHSIEEFSFDTHQSDVTKFSLNRYSNNFIFTIESY